MRTLWSVLLLLVVAAAIAAPVFKAGDRIVIYGDSITEQRLYSRYLQQYLFCRYPEMKLTVFNAGWSGDRAPGALNRLERDVLALNPTVVTLFFGMNDGGYNTVNDTVVNNFKDGTEGIIKALQARGVRVVVFTPGCVDPDRQPQLGECNYNATLEKLGQTALDLAKQYNCPSADVFHPMLAYQTARKAAQPGFTMIPDSVHPDANGHLVMAYTMLQGLGAEPMPALGTIDVTANTATGLTVVSTTAEKIVLETTDPTPVPFWFENGALSTMRDSGFLDFVCPKVTIKGLPDEMYTLIVNGARMGRVTAQQLAAGYALPDTGNPRGKLLHDLAMRKENNYFSGWREIRLPGGADPSSTAVYDAIMKLDEALHKYIHSTATPAAKTTFELRPVPATANLAEGATYVCSDPNTHNWGIGGLTDGSWEASAQHCFATNETDKFPKTVTIDLARAATIDTLIAGVPNFGSTKTIAVSVSADGKTFTEVGTHDFAFRTEARFTYKFAPVEARYVRLTYPNRYDEQAGYPVAFMFTTEVEVYPVGAGK